ncbi:hypothetical protein RJ45_14040 [Photobacterium gaetbulicola]|uniref:Uncharacterized protein n=1 Tax=Photobacterium gaetbulicola TaxID=1295392 RepID=A0A0B9GE76_9GAMM|nr:hypothetical protein RJ45_14040 [Photobacterium gaetbulicola]
MISVIRNQSSPIINLTVIMVYVTCSHFSATRLKLTDMIYGIQRWRIAKRTGKTSSNKQGIHAPYRKKCAPSNQKLKIIGEKRNNIKNTPKRIIIYTTLANQYKGKFQLSIC